MTGPTFSLVPGERVTVAELAKKAMAGFRVLQDPRDGWPALAIVNAGADPCRSCCS